MASCPLQNRMLINVTAKLVSVYLNIKWEYGADD